MESQLNNPRNVENSGARKSRNSDTEGTRNVARPTPEFNELLEPTGAAIPAFVNLEESVVFWLRRGAVSCAIGSARRSVMDAAVHE
jgi:hypothetical protein